MDLKYSTAAGIEGVSRGRSYGFRIDLAIGRNLTPSDEAMLSQKIEEIRRAIDLETDRIDPAYQADIATEKEKLRELFTSPIYMTPIANGYGERPLFPWFDVTTRRGVIEIGWRRRVISIDWSKSDIKSKAAELFPLEKVTIQDRSIHAWSYEKAREYIDILMGAK